jgi:hypothetical protein
MRTRSILLALSIVATLPTVHGRALAMTDEPLHEEIPGARTTHVSPSGAVKAGAARIDSTWHLGSPAGQYATDPVVEFDPAARFEHGVDPSAHSTRRGSSYGLQGREWVRALVIEGADGHRMAIVSNDLYIPQDLLNRRVAGMLVEHDLAVTAGLAQGPITRIDDRNMMVSVSHSHSSPYVSTPSWGVWAFQDTFDLRFFEHIARRMADAIIAAVADLRPARIGAAVGPFAATRRHSYGPAVADDGTPAGFPQTDGDKTVSVVRVDDASSGDPLATWVTYGVHPEMLDGNDLLTGEYTMAMSRFVDREVGGVTLFSQNDTGSAEPARDAIAHPPAARAEFSHREYAQMERAGRLLADAVEALHADIGDAGSRLATRTIPMRDALVVGTADARFAPPSARVVATVSNCRAERTLAGNPGIPIVGLPDCEYGYTDGRAIVNQLPPELRPGVTYEQLRAAGVPIPDNVPGPSYSGLEETLTVHLQAFRLGDIAITVCPCEQWSDQSLNIKSRLDAVHGNLFLGFDWTHRLTALGDAWCTQNADTTWSCGDPRSDGRTDLAPVSDARYRRMVAQIRNDAAGWDSLENTPYAETEPADIDQILGNFTHEELTEHAYPLVITTGMANDYWGYIASFREFQRGDHYRKALTGLGPHSMDFLATRLSRMAASLNGRAPVELSPKDLAFSVEDPHMEAFAAALGAAATVSVPAYEATLPTDGGTARILDDPTGIVNRFDAARVAWVGGSNYTDTPDVRVQRLVDGAWTPFADGSGEVQYRTWFPEPDELPAYRAGDFEWRYAASFETQNADIRLTDASGRDATSTPAGWYRFVIDGHRREGMPTAVTSYHLTSEPFVVHPWNGIQVQDLRLDPDGRVSFVVGPTTSYTFGADTITVDAIDYPDSYAGSPFTDFINSVKERKYSGAASELFCFQCSFRPRADRADIVSATVTGYRSEAEAYELPAVRGVDGRFRTVDPVDAGGCAQIDPGGIVDSFGETHVAWWGPVCRDA